MLDPAPASDDLPGELLKAVDILIPNESELATLIDLPTDTLDQITAAARTLIAGSRVGEIIVTLGGRGVL